MWAAVVAGVVANMARDAAGIGALLPTYSEEATAAAKKLLLSQLTLAQQIEYKAFSRFKVKSCDGHTYTIKAARFSNVSRDDGMIYCGYIADAPIEDQMLAQKLLLEHDPEHFISRSNVANGAAYRQAEAALRQNWP